MVCYVRYSDDEVCDKNNSAFCLPNVFVCVILNKILLMNLCERVFLFYSTCMLMRGCVYFSALIFFIFDFVSTTCIVVSVCGKDKSLCLKHYRYMCMHVESNCLLVNIYRYYRS